MSASFATSKAGGSLTLTFDRVVGVSGFNEASITVDHMGLAYGVVGVAFHLGSLVVLAMTETGPSVVFGDVLSASAASGIVAVNNGGTWPGVSNLGLPFP
jgi:hypothetical protein